MKDALRDPANLAAALGYYRATLGGVGVDPALDARAGRRRRAHHPADAVPARPHRRLHGRRDRRRARRRSSPSEGSRLEIVDGAGHFLHVEKPDEVNRLIVDFVTG